MEHNEVLVEFDRVVFESIIDKVIVGGYDDEGNPDPSMLTFIYKTGFKNSVDATKHKPPRKNSKKGKDSSNSELYSFTTNEDNNLCSYNSDNTYGSQHSPAQHRTAVGGGQRVYRKSGKRHLVLPV